MALATPAASSRPAAVGPCAAVALKCEVAVFPLEPRGPLVTRRLRGGGASSSPRPPLCGAAFAAAAAGLASGRRASRARPPRGRLAAAALDARPAVEEKKAALLEAVARANRGAERGQQQVLQAAKGLEDAARAQGLRPLGELVEGRWALVYSTQELQGSAGLGASDGLIDRLTAQVYRLFFRFAPALAGSQEGDAGGARSWWGTPRNEQTVDLSAGAVRNVVEVTPPLSPPPSWRARIIVEGEATPDPGADATALRIVFTQFSAGLVGDVPPWLPSPPSLPLPRPAGRLDTTFVDEELRVSRGGRGGLFVLRRLRAAATV